MPPEAQPGHHVGWWHKWGHAGDAGGGQRFAPALKGETEAHGANGARLAQGLIGTQRGRMWPMRGCFVSALMARRGWGPPPSLSARVGRAYPHSTGCCSPACCAPRELGLGRRQLGVSQGCHPWQVPMITQVVPALSAHTRKEYWDKAGGLRGHSNSPKSKPISTFPPTHPSGAVKPQHPPHSPWQGAGQ